MPLSESMQCNLTIVWFCTFGMIISFLMKSPLIILFLFMFVFTSMAICKSTAEAMKDNNNNKDDMMDDVELQPLEEEPNGSVEALKRELKTNKELTLGDLLAKY